jgi:hypothetical protein
MNVFLADLQSPRVIVCSGAPWQPGPPLFLGSAQTKLFVLDFQTTFRLLLRALGQS